MLLYTTKNIVFQERFQWIVQVSKFVNRNGANQVFVVYEGQQNTYITPDPLKAEALRNNKWNRGYGKIIVTDLTPFGGKD